jgi:hypothetical protein
MRSLQGKLTLSTQGWLCLRVPGYLGGPVYRKAASTCLVDLFCQIRARLPDTRDACWLALVVPYHGGPEQAPVSRLPRQPRA